MYQSRIIIVDRFEYAPKQCIGSEVARFDLAGVGYEKVDNKFFTDVFTEDIDFNLYRMDEQEYEYDEQYDEKHRRDCYGEHCKYASINAVMRWLELSPTTMRCRRVKAFYLALAAYKSCEDRFDELLVVHYGY